MRHPSTRWSRAQSATSADWTARSTMPALPEHRHGPPTAPKRTNWNFVIGVVLTGTWLCMRRELRQMLAQGGGAIVNTASVSSFVASPALPAYTAAKHGIAGLTRTAALEYVRDNIRVNAICPGATLTRLMLDNAGSSPDARDGIARSQPGLIISDPLEQAQAALWLCSDRASFVNGTLLTVDNAATVGGTMSHEARVQR